MAFIMRWIFTALGWKCVEYSITRGDFAIYDADVGVAYLTMGR